MLKRIQQASRNQFGGSRAPHMQRRARLAGVSEIGELVDEAGPERLDLRACHSYSVQVRCTHTHIYFDTWVCVCVCFSDCALFEMILKGTKRKSIVLGGSF